MNVLRVASISTAHLSLQTREWLEKTDFTKEGPAGGDITYGWFFYAHDDNHCVPSPAHAPDGQFPADLWACFEMARGINCSHVRFDRDEDAELSAEFPTVRTYDDEPAPVDDNGHLLDAPIIDLEQQEDGGWLAVEPHRDDEANEYESLEEAIADLAEDGITARHTRYYEPAEQFA